MRNDILISDVRFTAAPETLRGTGLRGWASCRLNDLLNLQGLAIRRTRNGDITISFPRRKDEYGTEHQYFEPVNASVRLEIERQVLEAIDLRSMEGQ
jgi:DNA-binding cell septation regulator SpoVG